MVHCGCKREREIEKAERTMEDVNGVVLFLYNFKDRMVNELGEEWEGSGSDILEVITSLFYCFCFVKSRSLSAS